MRPLLIVAVLLISNVLPPCHGEEALQECDLLVVGGSESAVAAAVQAARSGVKSIILVNDCRWLGGQFTTEGLGAVDEWTKFRDGRVPFPRSGLFLEIMQMIEADMLRKYGNPRPGNCFCAWTTCEPRDTERLFRKLVEPYLKNNGGPLEILEDLELAAVNVTNHRVTQVDFTAIDATAGQIALRVKPRITIDASDWGDVVRLSGAKFYCGPDLKERFDEPSAPISYEQIGRNEINPLTYNLVLRESTQPVVIPKPEDYDERRYYAATIATRADFQQMGWPAAAMKPFAAAWRDTDLPKGPYSDAPTPYHHRRLVDRRHLNLAPGTETVLVNWPLQDYPTDRYPQRVVDELEAVEPGASRKNLAEMSPKLRRIVFADAKRHSLGLLYHLQTTVAERDLAAAGGKPIVTFRDLQLTDEFSTPDRLPLKPYIREGLRTDCLYMVREQDVRDVDGNQCWAALMPVDGVFGYQFNIDFHPTRRIFLNDDPKQTWTLVHTKERHWHTDTDRTMLPLRSLIPSKTRGLIVAGKNLGVSSMVQAAVRLHGHGMLAGQAAATVASMSLRHDIEPEVIAGNGRLVAMLQQRLLWPQDRVAKSTPPGVVLWPYQDVLPDDPEFVAVNMLGVLGVYHTDDGVPEFAGDRNVSPAEIESAVAKARKICEPLIWDRRPATRRELVRDLYAAIVATGFFEHEPR
jgi:hypothetical protein